MLNEKCQFLDVCVLAAPRFTGLKSCVRVHNKTLCKSVLKHSEISMREASREFAHVHEHIPTLTHKYVPAST